VITVQGIFRAKITEDGAGIKGETILPDLIETDKEKAGNFRPSGVAVAPTARCTSWTGRRCSSATCSTTSVTRTATTSTAASTA
jgi:hypothetical protein